MNEWIASSGQALTLRGSHVRLGWAKAPTLGADVAELLKQVPSSHSYPYPYPCSCQCYSIDLPVRHANLCVFVLV
jgi:hypothetical protein